MVVKSKNKSPNQSLNKSESFEEEASRNFFLCGALQNTLDRGLHGLNEFPKLLRQLIERKAWYNISVAQVHKTVRFDKHKNPDGTLDDRLNFLEFITHRMPEGLQTKPELIERLLRDDPETLEMFRQIIYPASDNLFKQSSKTTDLDSSEFPLKGKSTQSYHRAVYGNPQTGRIGAPQIIKTLCTQNLISLRIAAKLGAYQPSYEQKILIDHAVVEIQRLLENHPCPDDEKGKKSLKEKINKKVKKILNENLRLIPNNPQEMAKMIQEYFNSTQQEELIKSLQKK
jgi:hypothetical protein